MIRAIAEPFRGRAARIAARLPWRTTRADRETQTVRPVGSSQPATGGGNTLGVDVTARDGDLGEEMLANDVADGVTVAGELRVAIFVTESV